MSAPKPAASNASLARCASLPACSVCYKPVKLELSKTDEDGQAVHEECYLWKLHREATNPQPKPH